MIKILHIQVLPKLSGAQKISLEILKALPDDKYQKWVLFSDETQSGDKQACIDAFKSVGAKVILSSKLKRSIGLSDIGATQEIYKLCKSEKFDIVHTHSTKPGIIGRIAASMARVPKVIHTVHGLAFHKFIRFPIWHIYWACEMVGSVFCDKIIMVNKFYSKYFKWFAKKTLTVYNGIDFGSLPILEKKNNEFPKVLFVGRLDQQKDPITLLKAARIVVEKSPQIIFTLVGDGEKHMECKEFIERNNLQANVVLAGWQNNVAEFYNSHDIFFAPSIYESFGLMFVEAGYYKLPTVTTNVEGIPEVVNNGVTGLTCDCLDSEKMAENILLLIENKELREQMGQAAFDRVTSLFSNKRMTQEYIELYESSIS